VWAANGQIAGSEGLREGGTVACLTCLHWPNTLKSIDNHEDRLARQAVCIDRVSLSATQPRPSKGLRPKGPETMTSTTTTTAKQCGSCTVCCECFHIEELTKPAGKLCPHASRHGGGCKIYTKPERPKVCGDFRCGWLMDPNLPEDMRPDRAGFLIDHRSPGTFVIHDTDQPHERLRKNAVRYLAAILGAAVILEADGQLIWRRRGS